MTGLVRNLAALAAFASASALWAESIRRTANAVTSTTTEPPKPTEELSRQRKRYLQRQARKQERKNRK